MPSSISSSELSVEPAAFTRSFLAVFILLLAVFVAATEGIIHRFVVPNHNFYRYAALFRMTVAETAIFGDSQVAYGIANAVDAVNLAYGGDDFRNIADKTRLYLSRTPQLPRRVILQAGLHHFSYQYVWRVGRDDSFLGLVDAEGPGFPAILHPIHRREIPNYWETLLHGADFVPRTRIQADGTQLVQGNLSAVAERTRTQSAARLAAELVPVVPPAKSAIANLHRTLMRDLRARGIDVCLVSMPVSPPLMQAMQAHAAFDDARALFDDLARSQDVRYVDYSRVTLEMDLFADLNHLNAQGAHRIGERILQDCFAKTATDPEEKMR